MPYLYTVSITYSVSIELCDKKAKIYFKFPRIALADPNQFGHGW